MNSLLKERMYLTRAATSVPYIIQVPKYGDNYTTPSGIKTINPSRLACFQGVNIAGEIFFWSQTSRKISKAAWFRRYDGFS